MNPLLRLACDLGGDPRRVARAWRGLPRYVLNAWRWRVANRDPRFGIRLRDSHYATFDRYAPAAALPTHYFHQDLWAARRLRASGVRRHVDVGSRVDGFVAQALVCCEVEYVDMRPLAAEVPGLSVRLGTLLALPYAEASLPSLSCLHVIEHVGLGRYGDPIDPEGHVKAGRELTRVLAPGGRLLIGAPVGRERLCFDAHRVFDPQTIRDTFAGLELEEFALVDDAGALKAGAEFTTARACDYGCGLFAFAKPGAAG